MNIEQTIGYGDFEVPAHEKYVRSIGKEVITLKLCHAAAVTKGARSILYVAGTQWYSFSNTL